MPRSSAFTQLEAPPGVLVIDRLPEALGDLQKLLRQQAAIARFGTFALRELDLVKILSEAARICAEGLAVPFSKVCKYRAEQNDLIIIAGYGWSDGVVGQSVSRVDMSSPQGRAFITGETLIIDDLREEAGLDLPNFYAGHNIVSTIDVIIKGVSAEPYGILEIDSNKQHDYDQYDVNFLTGFANVLAEAVATASHVEVIRSSGEQMKALLEEKDRMLHDKSVVDLKLLQSQKMEAVGQLTGGVAHDLNNILTIIIGTADILTEAVADRSELEPMTGMLNDAAGRGAELVRRLLAFARKQPLQPREIDVNSLVVEAANLLRPTMGDHVEVHLKLGSDISRALIDPNQLTNALLNLAFNSRDAMPQGGTLTIETGGVVLDEAYANLNGDVVAGNYVTVTMMDTGHGIPANILGNVFEPFFTTKTVCKGTGLGLSMVYGFVKQSHGHITIDSEEGHGTTIAIYLPRASGVAQPENVAISSSLEAGDETILVVEDDTQVRTLAVSHLRSLGYATLTAVDAATALTIINSPERVDLLFTDMISIRPLAAALRVKRGCESREYSQEYSHDERSGRGHHVG